MKFITKCPGGNDGDSNEPLDSLDEIVKFSPTSGEWSVLEVMVKARSYHAVSVISADEYRQYCKG